MHELKTPVKHHHLVYGLYALGIAACRIKRGVVTLQPGDRRKGQEDEGLRRGLINQNEL